MYCPIQRRDPNRLSQSALPVHPEACKQQAVDSYDYCPPIFPPVHGQQTLTTSPGMSSPQQNRLGNATAMPPTLTCSRNFSLFDASAAWPTVIDDDFLNPSFNGDMAEYNQIFQLANHGAVTQQPDIQFRDCTETPIPRSTAQYCASPLSSARLSQSMFDSSNGVYAHDYGMSPFDTGPPPYCPAEQVEQPLFSDYESYSDTTNSTPAPKLAEEDDMDKPYARLIYEALMQAPGRRMMLKDIYGWFVRNTTKPQESGTNGWQNSIRHNLSMNQAFENDKGDGSPQGHPRKANSVWLLTDHAIKYGVQSTTRYRKTGTAKKGVGRTPAIQRQRSGARGGRAARRSAARVRKQEERSRLAQQTCPPSDTPGLQSPPGVVNDTSPDQSSIGSLRPATPTDGDPLLLPYSLAPTSRTFQLLPVAAKTEQATPFDSGMSFDDYADYASIDLDTNILYKFEAE